MSTLIMNTPPLLLDRSGDVKVIIIPIQPLPWTTKMASSFFGATFRISVRRRFYSIIGKEISQINQNRLNFNLDLQNRRCHGIGKQRREH